jgi:hypothetical protein
MKRDVCQMQNWVFLNPDAKDQQLYNVLVFSDNELEPTTDWFQSVCCMPRWKLEG